MNGKLTWFEWALLGISICLLVTALCLVKAPEARGAHTANVNNVLGPYPGEIVDASANITIFYDFVESVADYKLQFACTGREILLAYNQAGIPMKFELISEPNQYRRSGNIVYELGAYEYAAFYYGSTDGWVASGTNIVNVSATTDFIKFGIIRLK